tara:strand:- start:234 stop:797 length:564 start_codon:yes stop_codon:yes gene_type:complete
MSNKINVLFIHFFKESKLLLTNEFNITRQFAFSKSFNPTSSELEKYDIIVFGAGKAGRNPKASEVLKYIPSLTKVLKNKKIKIFGLCYGMQILCHYHGNKLNQLEKRHKSTKRLKINGLKNMRVRFNHKFTCKMSSKKKVLASFQFNKKESIPILIKYNKNHYGSQFHFTNRIDRSFALKSVINDKL